MAGMLGLHFNARSKRHTRTVKRCCAYRNVPRLDSARAAQGWHAERFLHGNNGIALPPARPRSVGGEVQGPAAWRIAHQLDKEDTMPDKRTLEWAAQDRAHV